MDFRSLTFTDVSRHFGRRRVLHKASFRCEAGEIVALLGPNGAGKSTLISIAATLLPATSGAVLYGDAPPASAAALRARIGVVGHELFVYPELSAAENLAFFARAYAVPGGPAAVAAALARAGLQDRDDPVSRFSRGMRQKLALERALLHDPRLILLDEPFTGLDDAAVGALRARLAELRAAGRIVLLATHDLEILDGLADRALLLHAGKVSPLEIGPEPLRERYRRGTRES